MNPDDPTPEGPFTQMLEEQLELAAAKVPPLAPGLLHPSPLDHEEIKTPHASLDEVLLGNTPAPPDMVSEMAALESAPELSEEELARQALADGGGDGDPSTPE